VAESARRWTLEVPARTIVKLLAVAGLIWAWLQIWQLVLLLLLAVVLAVALDPATSWLERRGLPRGSSAALIILGLVAVVTGFALLAGSSLLSEGRLVSARLGQVESEIVRRAPFLLQVMPAGHGGPDMSVARPYFAGASRAVIVGILEALIACILTVYLLADGRRTYAWLLAYVPKGKRARAHATACQARHAVLAYIRGNLVTAAFATTFVLVSLSLLHVPAAFLLGLVAGVCDFVPVLGLIPSGLPAVLLALSTSVTTGLVVAALYVLYHGIENYVIVPKVYGDRLRLSHLAVLVAFAVGAALAGVVGAVLALPAAAMYPVVERLWLRRYLGADTVRRHSQIEDRHGDGRTIIRTVLHRS